MGQCVLGRGVAADVEAVRPRRLAVGAGSAQRAPLQRQGVGAGAVEPGVLPGLEVLAARRADRVGQVLETGVSPRVLAEVVLQPGHERLLAGVRAELLEHRLALEVGDGVEVGHRLGHVLHLAADGVGARAHVDAVALDLAAGQEDRPAVGVLGRADGRPAGGPGGEGLVEPQVVPPTHGDQVAEPHVGHLVQEDLGHPAALVRGGGAAEEDAVPPRHAAPVLHRAAHVGHEDLVVALLPERHAEVLTEPRQTLLGELEELLGIAVEHQLEGLAAVETEVVATALGPELVERAGVDHGDVRRQPRRVSERPEPTAVGQVGDRLGRGVAGDRPRLGGTGREAVHRLEVGLVEVGPDVAGHVGLPRVPHVDELVAGVDRAFDAVTARRVRLGGGHDEHVLGLQVGERQPATLDRGQVEVDAVEGGVPDLGHAVDEAAGARLRGRRTSPWRSPRGSDPRTALGSRRRRRSAAPRSARRAPRPRCGSGWLGGGGVGQGSLLVSRRPEQPSGPR